MNQIINFGFFVLKIENENRNEGHSFAGAVPEVHLKHGNPVGTPRLARTSLGTSYPF